MGPLNFVAQFDDLSLLRDGWLDGFGKAPSSDGLVWLHEAFESKFPLEAPVPNIYPTENGGVQAEWSLDPSEITLDVNLGTRLGEWHVLNTVSDDVCERTLNCDDAADWRWLVGRIQGMAIGDL